MTPRYLYLAGPMGSPDAMPANVTAALRAADRLQDAGWHVFIPHLAIHRHAARPREYEEWMATDFAWLRRCDAVCRLPGVSPGADREVALARTLHLPVYEGVEEAVAGFASRPAPPPDDGTRAVSRLSASMKETGMLKMRLAFAEASVGDLLSLRSGPHPQQERMLALARRVLAKAAEAPATKDTP